MDNNTNMETSPLTQELYSIDWAVRFDEFRKYDQSSYTDLHQLLAKIEGLVESEVANDSGDLNDIKILTTKFNKAKSGSQEWHRLSMLIHLKIILAAIPKGLTATATLSAIQIMEHMWKVVEHSGETATPTHSRSSAAKPKTKAPDKKPVVKAAPEPVQRKKPKTTKAASVTKATKTTNKPAANNKKVEAKTENVVIKKLAAEAGLDDDKVLEARCYEVASSLAEEYPEYTLTAIRVMTAEKLGVTRQFVENLDIKPARFKNG